MQLRFGKTTIICVAGAVILASSAMVFAFNKPADASGESVASGILVRTEAPSFGDLSVTEEFIGTVEPGQQVIIYPKVSAEVTATHFMVGETIERGDILCEMDSSTLKYAISQNQAAVSAAQAKAQMNLSMAERDLETYQYNMENGYDPNLLSADSNINSAEAAVINAETAVMAAENKLQTATATLSAARRTLREHRDRDEWDYGVDEITYDQMTDKYRDAVIQAEIAVEGAQIGLENAQNNLETAGIALNQAEDAKLTAQILIEEKASTVEDAVEMARLSTNFSEQYIAIQKLQNDLQNYTITAPISGVVEQCNVEAYDITNPQKPVYVISNKDSMTVSFSVSKNAFANIKVGDSVGIIEGGANYPGYISELPTMSDAASGLFPIKAIIENPPVSFHTGETVKILMETNKAENKLLIPKDALYFDNGNAYVYKFLKEEGTAQRTFVEIGVSSGDLVQIISGVTAADEIIVSWSSRLADGAEVIIQQDAKENLNDEADEIDAALKITEDAPQLETSTGKEQDTEALASGSEAQGADEQDETVPSAIIQEGGE